MENCIFCKIATGKIPCTKLYETENALAFLDIAPISKGHALVISKQHYENITDAPDRVLADLMPVVKKIATALNRYAEGVTIGQNNGRASGQIVDHIHFHVIPRHTNDGLIHWPHGEYHQGEAQRIANEIKKLL